MQSSVHFLIVLVIPVFASSIVRGDQSALCKTWSDIEQRLRNEDFLITCTMNNDCYGLNCSGAAHGYNVYSRIQLYACENPPSIEFEVNVPKLNVINKKRVYHNDSIPLTKNINVEFEVGRNRQEMTLGLFVHLLDNGSFPLLHIPIRIPLISHVAFPINCPLSEDTTRQSVSLSKSISSSSPTKSFLLITKGINDESSNCSIINSTCDEEEICQQIHKMKPDGICVCISNYTRNDHGKCVHNQTIDDATDNNPTGNTSHNSSEPLLLTAILVPVFVILLVVAAVYISIRFRVFQHLRRRLRVQVYEHVLLGEDDDEEDLTNPVA